MVAYGLFSSSLLPESGPYNRPRRLLTLHHSKSPHGFNRAIVTSDTSVAEFGKRYILSFLAILPSLSRPLPASALPGFKKDLTPRRKKQNIPIEDYSELQNGLLYYEVKRGSGPVAANGDRVAIHFDCKWRGVTFITSRQGNGVTGGVPFGFDVGISETSFAKNVIKGMDQGVVGMRVGGVRKLKVPPELAYGDRGVQEIPPNATLDLEIELLSIKNKTSPIALFD